MILENLDFLRKLLDSIPKIGTSQKTLSCQEEIVVAKETKFFIKKIDYALLN